MSYSNDPIAAWDDALAAMMTSKKLDKPKAVRALAVAQPELHAAYIAEYTARYGEAVKRPTGRAAARR